jgi:hypothetical protein
MTDTATRTPKHAPRPGEDSPGDDPPGPQPGNPVEEYKHIGDDLRHYGILRLYRLTLLLGTTGAIVTALGSETIRAHPLIFLLVRLAGLMIALVFAIMDYRSGEEWIRLQRRANVLAGRLSFERRLVSYPWNPLTTTGAGRMLHAFLVAAWLVALLWPALQRSA